MRLSREEAEIQEIIKQAQKDPGENSYILAFLQARVSIRTAASAPQEGGYQHDLLALYCNWVAQS